MAVNTLVCWRVSYRYRIFSNYLDYEDDYITIRSLIIHNKRYHRLIATQDHLQSMTGAFLQLVKTF